MGKNILTRRQKIVLDAVEREPTLTKNFILSGGTALAGFYLFHRDSEDLDFFSESEVDLSLITTWLKSVQPVIGFSTYELQTSFNRNLIFLHLPNETIKCEFTYFPFTPLTAGITYGALRVDSMLDIAVNKVFTISQKPRARDFIDLYCILKKQKKWTLPALLKKSRLKFDWHVDPLQFGTQLMKAQLIADLPRMRVALKEHVWRSFFLEEAKRFQSEVLT